MKIVVDANRIIAALIKSGTTRDILLSEDFDFASPIMNIPSRMHRISISAQGLGSSYFLYKADWDT